MDFVFANKLHLFDSVATGEITIPEYFLCKDKNMTGQPAVYCKSNILPYIADKYHVLPQNVIYVGSGSDGNKLLEDAGIGVAFDAVNYDTEKIADKIIPGPWMEPLLQIAQASPEKFKLRLPAISKKQAKRISVGSLIGLASAGLVYLAARQINKRKKQEVS
jgi:hypothetical protein